jgi:hypothetical protein
MGRFIEKSFLALGLSFLCVFCWIGSIQIRAQDELKIWEEFINTLMKDELTLDHIRTLEGIPRETIMGWLNIVKENVPLKDLERSPEFHRVDNKLHFIVPITYDTRTVDYCFTFLKEEEQWYFHLLETIFIRLDKTPPPPTSDFPDISEERKAFDREEWRVSKQVRLFNFLSEEHGKDAAFDWFCDGGGFFVAAQARVPFFTPSKAFILYLCWNQAKLIGNPVSLILLKDNEAVVEIEPMYFALYKRTGHLKEQIAFDDFKRMFETTWKDRAEKAGWNLEIEYDPDFVLCKFHFTK